MTKPGVGGGSHPTMGAGEKPEAGRSIAMTCKILVVDDEPEFCRLLASVLTEMGYEVSTASGGRQGLAKIRKNPPDVVFLDIKMPRMDGLECLRRLRKSKRKPVIVVMTGFGDIQSAREALRLGAEEYISKPFDLDDLKQLVNELVRELAGGA
jgi:CheY-like chemotaxis protein